MSIALFFIGHLLTFFLSSLHKAHEEYEELRSNNEDLKTMAVVFKQVLKNDLGAAYSECIEFNKQLVEKNKLLNDTIADFNAKHPTNADYFNVVFEFHDLKYVDAEISMLHDALNCLTLKREVMLDTKKETGNLQEVFARAVAPVSNV